MTRPRPESIPDATVSFTYESAYNQIVQPVSYVSLSQYFVAHWLPDISAAGLKILLRLRAMGYYDPKKGLQRGDIDIDQKELAGLCGLSLSTLKRAFADDTILSSYVQRVFRAERDPRSGRIVREHYLYVVKMDDVLIPADKALLEDMLQGAAKGKEQGPDCPIAQNDLSVAGPIGQNDLWAVQNDPPIAHFEPNSVQNDPPLNRSINTLNTLITSDTPAARPESFASLSEEEKEPWLALAELELRENFGLAAWLKTADKARASLRKQRAMTLYQKHLAVAADPAPPPKAPGKLPKCPETP
jgi:hypothetical protein